jgi:hypothetical protein
MERDTSHNDELHFRSIGLAAALILNKLRLATQLETREEHQEQSDRQTGRATAEKQCDEEQREHIDQRLKKGTALSGQVGEPNGISVRLIGR